MKLKKSLRDLFSKVNTYFLKHKQQTLLVTVVALLICIIIGCIARGIKADDRQREFFLSACSAYNATVKSYNEAVDRYNRFIDRLSEYNLTSTPSKMEFMEVVDPDSNSFSKQETALQEIDEARNRAQEINTLLTTIYPGLYAVLLNERISDFNQIVTAFNELMPQTSVDFIANFPAKMFEKDLYESELDCTEEEFFQKLDKLSADNMKVLGDYMVLSQITNPPEEWVLSKLDSVSEVTYRKAVTVDHDPNGLLGKDGGYSSCVYFNVKSINKETVKGADIVDKGTAVGGAIEVYSTLESAKNRCEYLSQFDGTLLYSGSYAIIGTMVVRTSYLLDNQEQIDITNAIVEAFTSI